MKTWSFCTMFTLMAGFCAMAQEQEGHVVPQQSTSAEKLQNSSGVLDENKTRKLRFVQDDAQDYMVSKIYKLRYVQANDITPFVLGIVKRYNMNSSADCVEYGADNKQLLTVTCPVGMMPFSSCFYCAGRSIQFQQDT